MGIQMQFEGAQSCTSEVKLQQENIRRTEGEPDNYSRESEANWNIHSEYLRQQGNKDNRSVRSGMSSSTNRSRPPNQEDLCKAIMSLRTKLPNRSLQQILIRLYQSIEYKRKENSISSASRSRKNYEPSVCSRKDDFDDSKSYVNTITAQNNEQFKQQPGSAGQTSLKRSQSNHMKKFASQDNPSQQHQQPSMESPFIPQARANYIYRPLGQQVVINYTEERTRKVNFINQQEEDRYLERRVMAKSFIEKGYGVSECRKEIQQQNLSIKMHRNTYKTLAGSVIILAFRKLQSFIANQCSKTIKNLDRWQMRSICTTMLNCRTNMQPQQMETLFKYIKASYGLGDVTIGQIESVKLYLAIQKNIHGKKVTMEDLERIGEIQQKKTIQLTHQYLNRKKVKRQQRLQKLRKLRIQVKDQKRKEKDQNKQETYRRLSQIDLNPPQLKLQADNIETTEGNSQNPQRQHSVSNISYSEGKEAESKQQMYWQQSFDSQLAQLYLESKQMLKAITVMQERHSQLANWSIELFQKRFGKLIKKSIKKVQIQSQMSGDSQLPVLNKLQKQQIRRLIYSPTPNAETVRNYLLGYFLLDDPDLEKLIEVVAIANIFFYGSALGGGATGEKRKGRGRPALLRRQPYRFEKDNTQYDGQNGYFLRQAAQYNGDINFDEDFSLVDEEIRKSLDEDLSSFNGDLDLDIDINDLRLQIDDVDPSSHPSEVSSDVKHETLSQNSFK